MVMLLQLKDHKAGKPLNIIKGHIVKCEAQTAYFNEIIDVHGNGFRRIVIF